MSITESQSGRRWKGLWEVIWFNFPLIGELLQTLYCLCVHSLEFLQYLYTFLVLGNPSLDTVLYQCLIEGKDYLPKPAGNTLPNEAQDTVDLWNKSALLAHVELGFHQEPQSFFKAVFHQIDPQNILVHRDFPPQVQEFALHVEHHEVRVSSFLQFFQVPLNISTNLWCINYSSQFCIISKLAVDTLNRIFQIFNEDIQNDWTKYWSIID